MAATKTISEVVERTWKKVEKHLTQKGFMTILLDSDRALRKFIYSTIPDNCVVGLGNSLSTSALKIRDILLEKGNKVYYAWNGANFNRSVDTFEEHQAPEYFLTNANTITPEGNIVNNEFSGKVAREKGLPKNVIAFSNIKNLANRMRERNMSSEFVMVDKKPEESNITVAFTSFA